MSPALPGRATTEGVGALPSNVTGEDRRFHQARLVARENAGGGLTRMTVHATSEVLATYTSPGQYIEVLAEEQTGFFVLANEPPSAAWELVMRSGGGASDVLLAARPGATFEVTGAIGPGFPMAAAQGRPLIVALGGTGIAAGRPVIRRRVAEGDAARTRLLVGARTPDELPTREDLGAWARAGVDVLVCLSQPQGDGDRQGGQGAESVSTFGLRWAHGYVQDVLRARAGAGPGDLPPDARIFAVGSVSMIQALKRLAPELGIPQTHVHTNH